MSNFYDSFETHSNESAHKKVSLTLSDKDSDITIANNEMLKRQLKFRK